MKRTVVDKGLLRAELEQRTRSKDSAHVVRHVASIDRIWAGDSVVMRLAKRSEALDLFEITRAAAYPLGWLVDTGRLSSEVERALLELSPRRFTSVAVRIAAASMSVRAAADAWVASVGARP